MSTRLTVPIVREWQYLMSGYVCDQRGASGMYHEGNRQLQDQFDTRRVVDRINEVLLTNRLTDYRDLIESRDMFFIATADEKGRPILPTHKFERTTVQIVPHVCSQLQ